MVHIDVLRAQALKQTSGSLSLEFPADDSLIDVPFVSFSSNVSVSLDYDIGDDGKVQVTGSVSFTLKGLCSRCTRETERKFTGEVNALFVPDGEGGEDYAYRNGKIVLDEAIRDAVMFALPISFLCEDACEIPAFH